MNLPDHDIDGSEPIDPLAIRLRLRQYGAVLDLATADHLASVGQPLRPPLAPVQGRGTVGLGGRSGPELVVEIDRRRRPLPLRPTGRRPIRIAGAFALVGVLVGGVVFVASRPSQETITVAPGLDTAETFDSTTVGSTIVEPASAAVPSFDGAWSALPESPLSPRAQATAVWTGDEVIVWGGHSGDLYFSDGAMYNPATNTWRSITPNQWGGPGSLAVWTGREMVVLAKRGGASYDPATDRWTQLPRLPENTSWGFTAIAYAGGRIVGIGAIDHGDGSSELLAASLALGEDAWTAYEPHQRDDNVLALGTRPAFGLDDGSVALSIDPLTVLRFEPPSGEWSTALSFPDPNIQYIDGWFVRNVFPVAVGGELSAVLGLQRFDGSSDGMVFVNGRDAGDDLEVDEVGVVNQVIDSTLSEFARVAAGDQFVFAWDPFRSGLNLIDPNSGSGAYFGPQPGRHGFDASIVAAGDRLFIWGGDLNSASQSAGDTDVSSDGSLWSPTGITADGPSVAHAKLWPREHENE